MKTFHIKPDVFNGKHAADSVLEFGALGLLPYRRILVALTGTERDTSVLRYLTLLDDTSSVFPIRDARAFSRSEDLNGRPRIFFHDAQKGSRKTLMSVVATEHIDLILVGCAARQLGPSLDLRYLVLQAPCPVWVVPDSGKAPRLQSIVVPMDLRAPGSEAVQAAAALAEARHIPECLALHVHFLESRFPSPEYAHARNERKWHAFAECISCVRRNSTWFKLHFEEGAQVSKVIRRFAEERGVDLIVMGTQRRSPSAATVLGSVVLDTVETSSVPVLVVKNGQQSSFLRELLVAMLRPKDVLQTS